MISNTDERSKINAHPNFERNNLPLDKRYEFKILTSQYVDQVVDVFTYAFCRSEPMTEYLKMDEEKYKIFARAVTEKAVVDQLSVIALDRDVVIACALTEDLMDPGAIPDFDPKFKYILALLESLGSDFFENKKFAKNHIAHLFITAVHEKYRHQGLSTQVNFHAMDIAAKKNFDFIYCEFTHYYNEKGTIRHLKNPRRLIGHATYKDFICEGEKPFAKLEGAANSYLWTIRQDSKLTYEQHGKKIVEKF